MKTYDGVHYRATFSWLRHCLKVSDQFHVPAILPPGKAVGTHWVGGWVDPRAGLDDMEKRKFPKEMISRYVRAVYMVSHLLKHNIILCNVM
jgi:hypothetical protein